MNRDELREKIAHIIGYHCFPSVIDAKNQRWYYEIADSILALLEGEPAEIKEKAQKWDKVKEIASSDYCSRCFNRFKCPSDDYAPCPFKDILEEVEGEKDDRA